MGDKDDHTPLHAAAYFGNYAMVRHFLKLGADPDARDSQGRNPLDVSKDKFCRNVLSNLNEVAYDSDIRNLNFLVSCGNKIDEKLSIFGEAPIHKAVLSEKPDNAETLKQIIDCEAEIDNIDANGWTALHHAAYKGNYETAQVLLESGARIDAFSNSKKCPIHFAALNNNYEILRLLIDKGAYIEALTDEGCTPIHMAAKKGRIESLEILLSAGANFYATDDRDWTALHYAAYNGHKTFVNRLLCWDADFERLRGMRNSQNRKAFEIAKDPKTKEGFIVLWKAAFDGDQDCIRNLSRAGADLNA